jgi:hypothetical protein
MSELKINDWVQWSDTHEEAPIGGMGGWFNSGKVHHNDNHGHTLQTYKDVCVNKDGAEHFRVLRKAIIEHGIRRGGDWHQEEGVPLFSDGTVAQFSYRAWGDLLAAIWSEEDGEEYTYMDFYMDCYVKNNERS